MTTLLDFWRAVLFAAFLVPILVSLECKAAGNEDACLIDTVVQVRANPAQVKWTESSVVTWSVDFPSGCPNLTVRFNDQNVSKSGNRPVKPGRTTTYTVSVGTFSKKSASTTVAVTYYPPVVLIDPSVEDKVGSLIGALEDNQNENQTVELFCDTEINLTAIKTIKITGDNRSLIASPDCERSPKSRGPLIFVDDKRSGPLFDFSGDNIKISGFRLQGPTTEEISQDSTEGGIRILPCVEEKNKPSTAHCGRPIEKIIIYNMEISQWSGSAISIGDVRSKADLNEEEAKTDRGRLFNTNPGAVTIKGNFIHHNRHGAGFGYGVALGGGAYATIEGNVFDENRHSITGASRAEDRADYDGYTARENLILSGGGLHCLDKVNEGAEIGGVIGAIVGAVIGGLIGGFVGAAVGLGLGGIIGASIGAIIGGWCWQTQVIDMHGTGDRWPVGQHECGRAGETILIERNTILYYHDDVFEGHVIKIRGNPYDKAVVDGNVFRDPNSEHAIWQNGYCEGNIIDNPIDIRPNNAFGVDPTTELGSCDFFGEYEGVQKDQFMATGVTWWAKSPVTQQWRYLNTMREKLPELLLGDFDHDGVCDVAQRPPPPRALPSTYSKSGTSAWAPLHPIDP